MSSEGEGSEKGKVASIIALTINYKFCAPAKKHFLSREKIPFGSHLTMDSMQSVHVNLSVYDLLYIQ